jgi:hypothetical protein
MNRKIILLLTTLLLISGCSTNASTAVVSSTATPTAGLPMLVVTVTEATYTPVPTSVPENDDNECDNAFYPVSDEATWTYNISPDGGATHTMSVDDNGAFTIDIQGDNSTFTIDGKCTDEGIVLLDSPGSTLTYTGDEGSSVISTIEVEGVTVPKDIKINDEWSQTIKVTTGDTSSLVHSDYTALGFENITVPAGNFYALKVEQSGYVEIYGQKVNMHGYQWFAEGVGTVKSAIDDAASAELVSYDIPD